MYYRPIWVVSFIFLLFALISSQSIAAQDAVAAVRNEFVQKVPANPSQSAIGSSPIGVANPNAFDLSKQGVTLVDLGLYKESVGFFEKAALAMPDSPVTWLNLSIVYDHLDRVGDSLSAARRAVEIDGDSRLARTQVCDMSAYSKLYREAFNCYAELEKMGPLDDRVLANYGIAALGMGDLAKARSILEPISSRQPYNAELLNALGVICFKTKNLPQAVAYFKRAIETDPDRGLFRYNMAVAQMEGRNRAAVLSQYHLLQGSDPKLAAELARMIFRDRILVVGQK